MFFTVAFRLGAVAHLRDSDKLLYLWRSRYVPIITYLLFAWGLCSSIFTLLYAVNDTVIEGGTCFAGWGDATMHWFDWWHEWTGHTGKPVGAGIVHPEGEDVLNPWILKANELGLTAPDAKGPGAPVYATPDLYDKYNEFMQDHFGFANSCDPQRTLFAKFGEWGGGSYHSAFWIPYLIYGFWLPLQWFAVWIFPTRNTFHYLTLQPGHPIAILILGPFVHRKINDPFDMTEAFEEFKFRAEIGAELAKKDKTGDGFIDLDEHSQSMSHLDVQVEEIADLRMFLEALGMSEKYNALAEEFELDDLASLAKKDAAACLIELKEAGVRASGDRIKIVNALVDGVPQPVAEDAEPTAKDVVEPPAVDVRVETEEKPGCFS